MVANVVPLLFAFVGAGVYGYVDKRVKSERLASRLLKIEKIAALDEQTRSAIQDHVGAAGEGFGWLPVYWSVAILLFCLSFVGTSLGAKTRVRPLQSTQELLSPDVSPTGAEMAHLHRANWILHRQNIPDEEKNASSRRSSSQFSILTLLFPTKKKAFG